MTQTNNWYVLAKEDRRYRYDFHPVFNRSHVFYDLDEAIKAKERKQKDFKTKLVILKRTCTKLEI